MLRVDFANVVDGHKVLMDQRRRRTSFADKQLDKLLVLAANDPTASFIVARVEMLELALERLPERDRQILDWRQDKVTWPEIARRLNVPSSEALRKQNERVLERVANEIYPQE